MPALPLGTGEETRGYGRLPHLQMRNMFIEADPTNTIDGQVRLQRPGLAPFLTQPGKAVNAVWQQPGTFNDDYLVVVDSTLFRVTNAGAVTQIGTVYPGRAQIVASATKAMIVSGTTAYTTDGATLTPVKMPAGYEAVSSIAYISGFFLLTIAKTNRFYWMAPGESFPDPLSFASKERSPDPLVNIGVVGDVLWLLGAQSEEVWVPSGDIAAPFQRINGRAYENGCAARDAVVQVNAQLIWVTGDNNVALSVGGVQMVSTPAISERIRLADKTQMRAWWYKLDTHVFYILTTDLDTLVLDLSTQKWSRFASGTDDIWRAHLGAGQLAGDSSSGTLWRIDTTANTDAGQQIVRVITAGIENPGAPVRCDNVSLRAAVGQASANAITPKIELRFSDDEANTWTQWSAVSLGVQGQYRSRLVWRKLGLVRAPGRIFEFRMTDDATFRLSYARINEAFS